MRPWCSTRRVSCGCAKADGCGWVIASLWDAAEDGSQGIFVHADAFLADDAGGAPVGNSGS